jgi:prepilin-type processing-associated H-X9-DG protein
MQLLPFVDQVSVMNAIDFNKPSPDASSISGLPKVAHTQIPVYKCPSNGGLTGISYRGCTGYGPDIFEEGVWPGGQGTFVDFDGLPVSEFRDGLSRTVAFSEKIPSDDYPAFGTGDFWYTGLPGVIGRVATAEEGIDALIKTCSALVGTPPYYHAHGGRTWYLARYGFTLYNHALPPNSPIADCSGDLVEEAASEDVRGSSIGLFTATSYHTGGVNVLYCDGHTEFVSNNIDLAVWRATSTRGSAETVSF